MKKLWLAIKRILKRFLPPPTSVLIRETDILKAEHAQLSRQLQELAETNRQQAEALERVRQELGAGTKELGQELERLALSFDAANRENLRQYNAAAAERERMDSRYAQLAGRMDERCAQLAERMGALEQRQEADASALSSQQRKNLEQLDSGLDRLNRQVEHGFHFANDARNALFARLNTAVCGTKTDVMTQNAELLDPRLYAHAIKMWYQDKTGRTLDLEHPQSYNEKIQWMKLYDHDPRKTLLADKLAVRQWVAERIGEEYLIPLLAVYDRAEDIDFGALPEQFVLKANHGSAWNAVVRDKSSADTEEIRRRAKGWLQTNFAFVNGYELHYLDIPRKLLAEQYEQNRNGDLPDYKFWCFDGRVHYIMYLSERQTGLKMSFFDPAWNPVPISYDYPRPSYVPERPAQLPEMIRLAETLAQGFPHVRVDLYLLDSGEIRFGEMTFSSASGACRWDPPEADYMLGQLLRLPGTSEETEADHA